MADKQLDVEHLFTLDLQVAEGVQIIKGGPHGTRMIAEVAGGTFTGERLTGSVVPPGGDWVTARADRNIQLDVRLTLVTDCLLYTSPSPRDLSTSRMPSSA